LKRAKISELARKSTAEVVKALGADVLCTIEVEDRLTLAGFNQDLLGKERFPYPMAIDGNDDRGIDVGVLSRLELLNIRTHIFDEDSKGVIFSRDCLQLELRLKDGRSLHFLCNHLKSKGYGSQAGNDDKRRRQARQIARILGGFNLAQDLVIVAGDMNDTPGSAPLAPLLNVPNLHDVLELQFGNNMQQRWTYQYKNQREQIDFLLASKPLRDGFQRAAVERRGIYGVPGNVPFASVTSAKTAASDHGAIWAEFTI
jgi:endonuclease/exonuclease/phosphatase family metal-dependent hydrolase